jgi:hypothetical protein
MKQIPLPLRLPKAKIKANEDYAAKWFKLIKETIKGR